MRTFIAVDIPQWMGEKIEWMQKGMAGRGIKLVERENLHVTIAFLGERDVGQIEEIKHSLSFLKSFNSVKAKVHGLSWFPKGGRPRVVYLEIHSRQFVELGETIRARLGIEEEFVPHLTIARVKGYVDREFMERLESLKDNYVGEFEIAEVKLKKSVLLPTRPVYSDIFTWKLNRSEE